MTLLLLAAYSNKARRAPLTAAEQLGQMTGRLSLLHSWQIQKCAHGRIMAPNCKDKIDPSTSNHL